MQFAISAPSQKPHLPIDSSERQRLRPVVRASARHEHDQQSTNSIPDKTPKVTSRRDLLKSGATLGFGGAAARALRLLGVSELAQVPRGLSPLLAEATKASQFLLQVESKLQPTVQSLLKMGLKPTQVMEMLQNPGLRPRNAAELAKMLRAAATL